MDIPYIILLVIIILLICLSTYNAFRIYSMKDEHDDTINEKHDENVESIDFVLDKISKNQSAIDMNIKQNKGEIIKLNTNFKSIQNNDVKHNTEMKQVNDNKKDIKTLTDELVKTQTGLTEKINDNTNVIAGFDISSMKNNIDAHSTKLSELHDFNTSNVIFKQQLNNQLTGLSTLPGLISGFQTIIDNNTNDIGMINDRLDNMYNVDEEDINHMKYDIQALDDEIIQIQGYNLEGIKKNTTDIGTLKSVITNPPISIRPIPDDRPQSRPLI